MRVEELSEGNICQYFFFNIISIAAEKEKLEIIPGAIRHQLDENETWLYLQTAIHARVKTEQYSGIVELPAQLARMRPIPPVYERLRGDRDPG